MKDSNHMSYIGVGPFYVIAIFLLTVIGSCIGKLKYFSMGIISLTKFPLTVIGITLIILGIILWIQAVIISKIDKNITENKLVTTGAYAWVRNPIYSAFAIAFTGILCVQNNLFLLILPLIYWLILTIIIKKEEIILEKIFGQEYLIYKSKVNRCIPWFPKKIL
ncbi:methyltransferase family protein [Clostridium hydrogenum]|uniref:methyltransferase family protein n=1 Tax=Clostridium hydrogenum TaxID=2855764 RepID=UPI001F43B127|nr:methyltransferase [Clostridium hydrogenum]